MVEASTSLCSGPTVSADSMCSRGTTSTCVGSAGLMSRNAYVRSLDATSSDGISAATILQKRQSFTQGTL